MDLDTFEALVGSIKGDSIVGVRYATIEIDGKPLWNCGAWHCPRLGVELTLGSGRVLQVGWGWEFYQYGLSVSFVREHGLWTPAASMWEATNCSEWRRRRFVEISSVFLYLHDPADDADYHGEYPQDLEIADINGRHTWILAARYDDKSDKLRRAADEIVVAFDETVIRREQFGRYAPADCLSRISST